MKRMIRILSVVLILVLVASFAVPVSASELPFTDVPDNYVWFDAIKFVYENGLMYGATETTFNPSGTLMRAMIVTILWRHAGEPTGYADPGFTDVDTTDFFYDAVCWAAELGITTGTTATTFTPYRNLTLLETLMFLYRYAHHEDCCNMTYYLPEPNIMSDRIGEDGYTYSIPENFEEAVDWAVNCGVVADKLTYFNGYEIATRAVCADYLYRFISLATDSVLVLTIDELEHWPGPKNVQEKLEKRFADVYYFKDLFPISMEFALCNNSVVYIRTHGTETESGNGEGIATRDGKYLMKDDIQSDSMADVDLVYLSACYAGDQFGGTLKNVGKAKAVVGFMNMIWSVNIDGDYSGSDYFDEHFFYYYSEKYLSLWECASFAKLDIFQEYGDYRGTDSIHVYE